jgi:hypothetical protein
MYCYTNVGPRSLDGLPRHRRRHQGDDPEGGDTERLLQNVSGNLSRLMQRIPMVQVEDIPEVMQRNMVGVLRAWVRLFLCLTNIVLCYDDTHPTP